MSPKTLIIQIWFNLDNIFYGPGISRNVKILVNFCPKFLDLYASIYGKFLFAASVLPFRVGVNSLAAAQFTGAPGFNLMYTQAACSSTV
jgi:hypothetical protein